MLAVVALWATTGWHECGRQWASPSAAVTNAKGLTSVPQHGGVLVGQRPSPVDQVLATGRHPLLM